MTNKEYARSLRLIADFYDPLPDEIPNHGDWIVVSLYDWLVPSINHKSQVSLVARALGDCEKYYSGSLFELIKKFGDMKLGFCWSREAVCERKIVGYRDVEEFYRPAHKEEIIEWECKSILESEKE